MYYVAKLIVHSINLTEDNFDTFLQDIWESPEKLDIENVPKTVFVPSTANTEENDEDFHNYAMFGLFDRRRRNSR